MGMAFQKDTYFISVPTYLVGEFTSGHLKFPLNRAFFNYYLMKWIFQVHTPTIIYY